MKALVSILIPFKNTSLFIEECLLSILSQSYASWEAIFVDDFSTDNSYSIIEAYANNESRIKLVKNNGKGIIDALRTAYGVSKGVFITRMDSDDIMTSDRLQWMVSQLHTHGKGHIAVGQVKYFRSDGVSDGYARYETWINSLTETGSNYSQIYKECVIPSPCWMAYRDDFEACDAFLPDRYPEDYDLTFRFYQNQLKCIPCDQVLLHWRDYATRTSRTHEHYAQNYFLDIKTHFFLKLDYDEKRPLTIWGAGYKGKTIAKLLIKANVQFYWICDNPKKIGKQIYNQSLFNFDFLSKLSHPQSIVTVANETAQQEIKLYFESQDMKPMTDYFFFC
ncbi:glycosyltransferase family 2 protein [Winogradskyella sp. DF17]|uniref:Glycosyltransferase family 2 protein n=1 Tax=Winogradskyella pelagia TaxID=2819984 RepID=A0ABS3T459_9FLAO|nr:glycosyltransferase family 2 protein [Winogradskyella sp. DF17]MBO3117530.1 glycosyltransferase family 2 protein [Winogradskyella sp. DF17]